MDRQLNLWNVAITRARSHLIVVGNRALWSERRIGAALLNAAVSVQQDSGTGSAPDELQDRLFAFLAGAGGRVTLQREVRGHLTDAVVEDSAGTGSGKTESFLIPILDHVVRAKKQGVAGMKALIIYPMNALANVQEQRLARLISAHPELSGVTAGLYTGEQSSGGRTLVSAEGLITDRRLVHDSPPDILLTNYKMLDHLLLRPDRASMWRQSAESLQYVVVDEFHALPSAGRDRAFGVECRCASVDPGAVPNRPRAVVHHPVPLGR